MALLAVAVSGAAGGCLTRPIEPQQPNTTSTVFLPLKQSSVDKIDLLLMVDNSSSMGDKQDILSVAIPDLLGELLNPSCVDAAGKQVTAQPAGPLDPCPDPTSQRELQPVLDIHVGLISSSLGTFGADGCGATPSPNLDDQGHLLNRSLVNGLPGPPVSTYQNQGFLAWDPGKGLTPPGETSTFNLETSLTSIVKGDAQEGCGFESQNESWYRLLVDPAPYANYSFDGKVETKSGTDSTILQQRKDFLRPDSLLAIINVTDETDTSIKQQQFYPAFAQLYYAMPHATTACTTKGPLDACCTSCGLPPARGCPANADDPACATSFTPVPSNAPSTGGDDAFSLHAFGLGTHKARYGVEFFYPPSRYVEALTSPTVTNDSGKPVPNPLFTPATPGGTVRDKGLVFYAAITGVPWQLIARQIGGTPTGAPDLTMGVSALDPTQQGGFKSSAELALKDAKGHTFWDDIVGDPESYVAPISPFMQELSTARSGVDPITGLSTASGNAVNGGERTIPGPPYGDIEYACTFLLPKSKDCSLPGVTSCDCCPPQSTTCTTPISPDNPLCAPNPNDLDPITHAPRMTLQIGAKAYPGIKNLAIVKGVGNQGIAASICPKQLDDATRPDYGYRPAMQAILDRLKQAIGGECLPRPLTPNAGGQVPCLVIEARNTNGAACACDGAARVAVSQQHQPAVTSVQSTPLAATENWNCFCEITQTSGAALTSCENDPIPKSDGWCYVSSTVGNPALVSKCPPSEKQQVRFAGAGNPVSGATTFITCASD
jgi:hypothetical protein